MNPHDSHPTSNPAGSQGESWPRLENFLKAEAFIVLTHNASNAASEAFEAWAYQGPLNFDDASPIRFGLGRDPRQALVALDDQLATLGSSAAMPASTPVKSEAARHWPTSLRVDRRELATILAALRFHQDENLQGSGDIPDQTVGDIATDGGALKPLNFAQVERLCQRLNCQEDAAGLKIDLPHRDLGPEPLFRVVYSIDVNAANVRKAADKAHRIMTDPQSQPPVLQVIDHRGTAVTLDLST